MNKSLRIFTLIFTCVYFLSSTVAPAWAAMTYTYDANGNMSSDGTKCYEYNDANQVKRVKYCGNNQPIADYVYDYNGDRIVKKQYQNGNLQKTVVSPNDSYEIMKPASTSATYNTTYYYANDQLIAKEDPYGNDTFYHNDHLGSSAVMTDENGDLVEETSYDPWGEVKTGGTKSKFQYTGQEKDDETGLNYYNARYYDPHIRRFTQPDDLIQNVYDPQMLNRYAYVRNNPLRYTDPTGNCIGPLALACYAAAVVAIRYAPTIINTVTKWVTSPAVRNTAVTVVNNIRTVASSTINVAKAAVSSMGKSNPTVVNSIENTAANVPKAADPKLQNLINNNLYKGANNPSRIGSGSTADAIRNEARTGQETFGKMHKTQGKENINALNNWLKSHPDASPSDIRLANEMKRDIINALEEINTK